MPLLELDTLVSSDDGGGSDNEDRDDDDPYAPAQSLRLRIGEDIEWSDVIVGGAVAVLKRDDSTKGAGANPKCAARRSVAAAAVRGSLPPCPAAPRAAVAVVIGGLPAAGKAGREHGRRRSPCRLSGRARVFAAAGEVAAADRMVAEPGSPKVSCLGGVRSQTREVGGGVGSGRRRWWAWMVSDVVSCCWNGRRQMRPRVNEAD